MRAICNVKTAEAGFRNFRNIRTIEERFFAVQVTCNLNSKGRISQRASHMQYKISKNVKAAVNEFSDLRQMQLKKQKNDCVTCKSRELQETTMV